jgi:hypothetical protein
VKRGAGLLRSYHLALLAEAYGKAGQIKEGLVALAEALAVVDKSGERFYEAELYRLRGELTLQQFKVQSSEFKVLSPQPLTPNTQAVGEQEAEECFLKAITIARKQHAKSLELRAVMSFVRLRLQQATREESLITDHAPRPTHHGSRPTPHETRARLDEAYRMLSALYGWFIEGFDTADLQEAKVLLEELKDGA